jgi:hypothetical protein
LSSSDAARPLVEISEEMNDWMKTDSTKASFGPVTDQRWEGFPKVKFKGVVIQNKILCFSIYSNSGHFNLTFNSDAFKDHQSISCCNTSTRASRENSYQWFHYAIMVKNNAFTIFSNYRELQYKLNFNPKLVAIDDKSVKLHDYKFLYSDRISSNYSYLIVSSSNNYCLSMFVAVEKNCSLEIILNVNKKHNASEIVNGFNDSEGLKIWKDITIRSNFSGQGNLSFFRRCLGNQTTGYWAIDGIHYCNDNIESFSTTLPSNNTSQHVCKNVNAQDRGENNTNFCDRPGYLGKNCNITCEKSLGKSHSNCEKHKICLENEICSCAWGYKGTSCTETCNNGYWGLNCSLTCDMNT